MIAYRRVAVPTLLAGALLVAGCGGGDDGATAGSASSLPAASSTTTTEPGEPTDGGEGTDDAGSDGDHGDHGGDAGGGAPPFPANTDPDTAEPAAGSLVGITEVRLGRHEGFDRVVFEAGGSGAPGWDVRYVDAPSSQGSGAEVAVAGEAVLQVTLSGTGYPVDTGVDEWAGPDPLRSGDTEVITEVVWDGTFEGTSVAFVGTSGRTPFRVYRLEQPARVVLEVADAR